MTTANTLAFSKMHGLGNDFMIIDATTNAFSLSTEDIARLGNRKTGVGFDQLLVVEPAETDGVDFNYRIFNTDGSEVEHCGNGARCFAKFVIDKGLTNKKQLAVKVKKGIITTTYHDDDHIEVDMGKPFLTPSDVPFICEPNEYKTQYSLQLGDDVLPASVLSMGNPHVVFYVSNIWGLHIKEMGKAIQQLPCFPESVNVNFVEVVDKKHLQLRTYERGVGETDACGTGACASAFASYALGAVEQSVRVSVRGGDIDIRVDEDGTIFMTGAARLVFDGQITLI